jgi:hypothetical protein
LSNINSKLTEFDNQKNSIKNLFPSDYGIPDRYENSKKDAIKYAKRFINTMNNK